MKYLELVKGLFTDVHEARAKYADPYVAYSIEDNRLMFNLPHESVTYDPYVTFTAEEDGSSIGLAALSTNQTMEYSMDTITWNTFDTTNNISLPNTGDKVYIRGILSADNTSSNYTNFKMSGKITANGNCNAIWNHQDLNAQLRNYCGCGLFYECTSLTTTPELPATTLAGRCYEQMFYNCSSLTTAPELPATELADHCYNQMFYNCSSLTTASDLPATTLGYGCCRNMFSNCSSLIKAPEILPAQTLTGECYHQMFSHCTSLKVAPKISATTLANYCCTEMFWDCPNLEVAPVLLSPKVELESYLAMFHSCSNLKHVECHAIDMSTSRCVYKMFYNINTEGTLIKHPDADWANVNAYIPSGWTVVNVEH